MDANSDAIRLTQERDKAQEDAKYWRELYHNLTGSWHKVDGMEYHEFAEYQRTINKLTREAEFWQDQYLELSDRFCERGDSDADCKTTTCAQPDEKEYMQKAIDDLVQTNQNLVRLNHELRATVKQLSYLLADTRLNND